MNRQILQMKLLEEEIPYYYRQHKKLSTFYTGYVIELTNI